MKARLIGFTLLVCLFALALPWAGIAGQINLDGFSYYTEVFDINNGKLVLKDTGSGVVEITFDDGTWSELFTQKDERWVIDEEKGAALLQPKAGEKRLPDGGTFELVLEADTNSISFDYSLDTEEGYDFFKFYIGEDETPELTESGTKSITPSLVKELLPGKHTFRWVYKKDECGRSGTDTPRLHKITLGGAKTRTGTAYATATSAYAKEWKNIIVNHDPLPAGATLKTFLATSEDGTLPTTGWVENKTGTIIKGPNLHIKLVFTTTGESPAVQSITYEAVSIPSVVNLKAQNETENDWIAEDPILSWQVMQDGSPVSDYSAKISYSKDKNSIGTITTLSSGTKSPYPFRELPSSGTWYFKVMVTAGGAESAWSSSWQVNYDKEKPSVSFADLQKNYIKSNINFIIKVTDNHSGLSADPSKSSLTLKKGNETITGNITRSLIGKNLNLNFSASLGAPGWYIAIVSASDNAGNTIVSEQGFLLGELAIQPAFVVIPKENGATQGFQLIVQLDGEPEPLDLKSIPEKEILIGDVNTPCGTFAGLKGSTLYFTANGNSGVGSIIVSVGGLQASARFSTGTGMVARLEKWDSQSLPVTVYTPGGIKIAELPPQKNVSVWDGFADYGKHAGKQGLPGIYLFKAEGKDNLKETLLEDPVKSLDVVATKDPISFTTTSEYDVLYASAYIKQGSKIVRWLGTETIKSGEPKPNWTWDGQKDVDDSGDYKVFVRLVTPGGAYKTSEGLAITQPGITGQSLNFMSIASNPVVRNDAGQIKKDDNWEYEYNEAGQLIAKIGRNNQGAYTYYYNMEGRRIRTELNGQLQSEITYDGDGRKVKELKTSEGKVETTFYVYDKDERLAYTKTVLEKDGEKTEIEKTYPKEGDN